MAGTRNDPLSGYNSWWQEPSYGATGYPAYDPKNDPMSGYNPAWQDPVLPTPGAPGYNLPPDSIHDPSKPPTAIPGQRWVWTGSSWASVTNFNAKPLIGLPFVGSDGEDLDYTKYWRKPRKKRSWWSRALWLPWKKY